MPEWNLRVGGTIKRTDLHDRFGGSRYSGISPSAKTPNVFLFSDPASGEQHGYFDRWKNGCFHYTGEGQHGNQRMIKGNLAILESQRRGKALRLFKGTGGKIQYEGRFQLDPDQPYYEATAPQTGGGRSRQVIIFKLRRLDRSNPSPLRAAAPGKHAIVTNVAVEENNTERSVVTPTMELRQALRREAALLRQFTAYMERQTLTVQRKKIIPPGETHAIYTDAYVKELNILIEAKGSIDRNSIRMAIGQLLDYKRFMVEASVRCAVLLPRVPPSDLLRLLASTGILLYVPQQGKFALKRSRNV